MEFDQFKESFIEEANEMLSTLEENLLELESDPENADLISAVFRVMHTLKGSASMFGFQMISDFAHHVENVLDRVRNGELAVTKELIDYTLKARDHVYMMLENYDEEDASLKKKSKKLVDDFLAAVGVAEKKEGEEPKPAEAKSMPEEKEPETDKKVFKIIFYPPKEIFLSGGKPSLLLDELAELGECSMLPLTDGVPLLDELNTEVFNIGWTIFLTTSEDINAIKDVFIFVESESTLKINEITDFDLLLDEMPTPRLGEILVRNGVIEGKQLDNALGNQKKLGEILVKDYALNPSDVKSALKEQSHLKKQKEKAMSESSESSIRVKSEKLDTLMNLIGELVTTHARIQQQAIDIGSTELMTITETLGRLTENLRENTMGIRLLPIGTTFNRFRRLVRDLSGELGKEINLITEGGETELDKTVIEKLNDPMVHLIRNSIDHGIETPAERKAAGKPEAGEIKLSAVHSGTFVHISIVDDGAGLNRDRILKKGIEKGLLQEGASPSDDEIYNLIFEPGFSTSAKVTNVSGRGVGMDVVRKRIEALNGSISVSSVPGKSTRISLKLPLTLAIIDGMLVRIGDDHFVFPLSTVEACIEAPDDLVLDEKKKSVNFRDTLLPFIDLRSLFRIQGIRPGFEQIVVVRSGNQLVGFLVDQVVGNHQTVVKTLNSFLRRAKGLSGATLLGNGDVALILESEGIIKRVLKEERIRSNDRF